MKKKEQNESRNEDRNERTNESRNDWTEHVKEDRSEGGGKTVSYFRSHDKKTDIHVIAWRPAGMPRAIVQICHGMQEYIERYEAFALWLTKRGIMVVGHDHLGHGRSVRSDSDYGFFHEYDGNECLLADIDTVRRVMQRRFPDVPYFVLGHSMGSGLTRQYMARYGRKLSGVILSGAVAKQSVPLIWAGKLICRIDGVLFGQHHRSRFIQKMAMGGYNKRFEPSETGADWISSDTAVVNKYARDPMCAFGFTTNGFYTLIDGTQRAQSRNLLNRIPEGLPVLLVAGEDDPVGGFGGGVRRLYRNYKKRGMRDVCIRIYPGMRHEILNEREKKLVYRDIWKWVERHI